MDQNTISEGKTAAIISYITVIGLLIAYIINSSKQNSYTQFHVGQSLRIVILAFANSVLTWFLPHSLGIITSIISLGILVLMVLGIINAVNGKTEPLPLIGTIGQ